MQFPLTKNVVCNNTYTCILCK